MVVSLGKKLILLISFRKSLAKHINHKEHSEGSTHSQWGLFGRRQGRPLGAERQEALDTLLPKLDLAPLIKEQQILDLSKAFGQPPSPLWMEIGFGNGEHVETMMQRNPDHYFIAAEPFVNGMSAFLKSIQDHDHGHIRVLMDDAMKVACALPDSCLDGIYILNPDPWPKTRHHKRRIVNPDNLDIFARILKPGAQLIMTTDVPDLADWMVTHANNHPDFLWTAENFADWHNPPKGWIRTRYEVKGAKGAKKMVYLLFKRKA